VENSSNKKRERNAHVAFCYVIKTNTLFVHGFFKHFIYSTSLFDNHKTHSRGRRGRDRMVVGFTTTCAIGAYHH
jgi:hypothetical protein